jgi:uncharacterized protein YfcZ (UPF0381/DUF406 family)
MSATPSSGYITYAMSFMDGNTPAEAIEQITDERDHAQQQLDNLKEDASQAENKAKFLTSHKARMDSYTELIARANKAIAHLKKKMGGRRRRTGKAKKTRKNMTRRRR